MLLLSMDLPFELKKRIENFKNNVPRGMFLFELI
jgi:hypothetical protein